MIFAGVLKKQSEKVGLTPKIKLKLMLETTECSTISIATESGFSSHKVKEVSNYMIKTIFLRFRRGVVGVFPFYASLLRSVYALTVSALTERTLSIPTDSQAGPTARHLPLLPPSRTRYSASPKHLHRRFRVYFQRFSSLSLLGSLS